MKKLFGKKKKAAPAEPAAAPSGPIVTPLKPGDLGYPGGMGGPRNPVTSRARTKRDTILASTLGG